MYNHLGLLINTTSTVAIPTSNENRERRKDDNTLSDAGESVREGASDVGSEVKEQAGRAGESVANKAKDLGRETKEALT